MGDDDRDDDCVQEDTKYGDPVARMSRCWICASRRNGGSARNRIGSTETARPTVTSTALHDPQCSRMASSEPNIVEVSTISNRSRNRASTPDSFGESLLMSKNRIWNSRTPVTAVSRAITDWKYWHRDVHGHP